MTLSGTTFRTTFQLLHVAGLLSLLVAAPAVAEADSMSALKSLSIEELMNIDVTSVSKTLASLSTAPAAIYVITHQDVVRSGATSIPEVLRLAPNLHVVQISPSNYTITARGFSGNSADQNFSDKLLVLIDGRTVYSPLYSGVYWDAQDVVLEDIERIEVISGPGATLWGANAVNGVINIITRHSADTEEGTVAVGGGNLEKSATVRIGGQLSDVASFRVYAKGFERGSLDLPSGASADDGWSKMRVPGHDGQRFRSDGGQHSGGMTDTVPSSWRTICASERNPVRHRGEVSGMIPERTVESAVDST